MPVDGTRFVRPDDLAERYDISPRKLQRWRSEGGGPPFIRLGNNTVRYLLAEVERWERDRAQGGGAP